MTTRKAGKPNGTKPAKPKGTKKGTHKHAKPGEKAHGMLTSAANLLKRSGKPMNCKTIIDKLAASDTWKSPGGKTPHATLSSAILREIKAKGSEARFKKVDRGMFTAA